MNSLKYLVRYFEPGSEGLRRFFNLLGQWWRETDGGRRAEASPEIVSDGSNGKMKAYLKKVKCPIRLLPAVKSFKIQVGRLDKLFLAFGLKRKLPGRLEFEVHSPNIKINRYVYHMVRRLEASRNDPRKYFRIAKVLLCSKAYLVCSIGHVLHGWHRNLPYWMVLKVAKKVHGMCFAKDTGAQIKRVYIEKTSGKWRPLGVPTPAWRVYSHMIQNLLTFYLQHYVSESQHGFLPGRGVITAWEEVLSKAIQAPYLKEYDLQNFFGEVDQAYVSNCLRQAKVRKT